MQFTVGQGIKILEGVSGLDIAAQVAVFKGTDDVAKTEMALIDLQLFAKLAGYVFPAAATASQWIALAAAAYPIMVKLDRYAPPPSPLKPGEFEAFGHHFNGTLLQGSLI